mgnify:CR=1 FL=1
MADQWARIRNNLNPEKHMQQAAAAVGTMVIIKTPVLDGYLKASWNFAVGRMDKTLQQPANNSLMKLAQGVDDFRIGQQAYFVNAQPYAFKIEYLGHSMQAPQGMLRISIADWQQINNDIARRNK